MDIRRQCNVELFASRLSTKLSVYFRWKHDPGATVIDAMSQDWRHLKGIVPSILPHRQICLSNIHRKEVPEVPLIAPLWPVQIWFPQILRMLVKHPVLLPNVPHLLTSSYREPHPLIIRGQMQLVECVRSTFPSAGFSEEAINLLCASWRPNTEASYNSAWKQWCKWCESRHINPLPESVTEITEFLTQEFRIGKSDLLFQSLTVGRNPVGKHPVISRLLKGAYHIRPPQPKYSGRWKVSDLLNTLKSWGQTKSLKLRALTHKKVMLMALTNADRALDLHALDIRFMCLTLEGATFQLAH